MAEAGSDGPVSDAADSGNDLPGKDPIWAPLEHYPAGCPVDRVQNAAEVRAFTWKACEATNDCEEMVFTSALSGSVPFPASRVAEEGGTMRVMLSAHDSSYTYVIFAGDSGWMVDAYRVANSSPHCLITSGASAGDRYGSVVTYLDPNPTKVRVGGLLHSFGAAGPPMSFDIDPAPPGSGPAAHPPMSSSRWMWTYYPDKLISVATKDGADLVTVAGPVDTGPLLGLKGPISIGDTFLFSETYLPEGGPLSGFIASSNGVDPPTPYLVPPDTSFYAYPVFAGTHLAWFRGIGVIGPNQYQAVEIWASPFSVDPAGLQPYKVGDFPANSTAESVGGHGRFATLSAKDAPAYAETYVWDLAKKTHASFVLPGGRRKYAYFGLTSTHLWMMGTPQDPNLPADLTVRFKVN